MSEPIEPDHRSWSLYRLELLGKRNRQRARKAAVLIGAVGIATWALNRQSDIGTEVDRLEERLADTTTSIMHIAQRGETPSHWLGCEGYQTTYQFTNPYLTTLKAMQNEGRERGFDVTPIEGPANIIYEGKTYALPDLNRDGIVGCGTGTVPSSNPKSKLYERPKPSQLLHTTIS